MLSVREGERELPKNLPEREVTRGWLKASHRALDPQRTKPWKPWHPLTRAEHRAWIEFGSSVLNDVWGFYTAPDPAAFDGKAKVLVGKFTQLEQRLSTGPYFDGEQFSLVDAVFGPVFRYFDVFDQIADFGILADMSKVNAWRTTLAARPSIKSAVAKDY